MKTILTLLLSFYSIATFSQQVRISEVFGAGGEPGATWNQDFVELFNSGTSTIDISGWSVQYATAAGSTWSAVAIPPSTNLAGGMHFLIGLATSSNGNSLPTPDITSNLDISNTEGKIALVNTTTLLNGANACSDPTVVDLLGYGATASCYQTAPFIHGSIFGNEAVTAITRLAPCSGNHDNSHDFYSINYNPTNNAAPAQPCSTGPAMYVMEPMTILANVGDAVSTNTFVDCFNLNNYPGLISFTAPAGIEISFTNGSGYAQTISFPFNNSTEHIDLSIRVNTSSPRIINDSILCSGGGTSAFIHIHGTIKDLEPTVQTSNITTSNITDNGMDINWTNGNGSSRIVVVAETIFSNGGIPTDAKEYSPNTDINLAATTTIDNYVVYSGTGSGPVTISGLLPGTNYTITAFEYNGGGATNNYYTASFNNTTATTTGSPAVLLQRNLGVLSPMYMASGGSSRMPTMFLAYVSNLLPNTTYRYYTQAATANDLRTYSTGAGDPILIDYTQNPVTYSYSSSPSLVTPGSYGKFTTNSSGWFEGYFGFVHNTDARFTPGDSVLPAIALAAEGAPAVEHRFAAMQAIKVLQFSTGSGPSDGSFLKGLSSAPAGRVLFLYNDCIGVSGRPLASGLVEGATIGNDGSATWGNNFIPGYNNAAGSWNAIIPNVNPQGVQLIQAADPVFVQGNLGFCNKDCDGTWPSSGVVTANPSNGASALQLSTIDAPLDAADCYIIVPVKLSSFDVQKMSSSVKLYWTTAQETNSKEFVIERSSNGSTWTSIATIPAAGNSSIRLSYSTTDFAPVKGINLYRIRQVDLNGRSDYSPTRSVLFNTAYKVLVTPNPATTMVNVYVDRLNGSQVNVQIWDASGRIVRNVNADQTLVQINTTGLSTGLYYVKVVNASDVTTSKIIIR